jgi:hypothetical protein
MQRAIRFGRGIQRMSDDVHFWFGIPRYIFRDLPKEALFMTVAFVSFNKEAWFRSHWRFNVLLGRAIEARKMARKTANRVTVRSIESQSLR